MRTGKRIVKDLRKLLKDIKSGKPIEMTEVRRYRTPDGPMHTRRKVKVRLCGRKA